MFTNIIRPLALGVFVAALCFVAPGSVWAAAIKIDDTSPNEIIIVSVNDFEGGFDLNEQPFQSGLNNPVTATLPKTDAGLDFFGTWIAPGQPAAGGRIYLVEQRSGPLLPTTQISDIFEYQIDPIAGTVSATISGFFVSADNLGFLPSSVDPVDVFFEDGTPVRLGFVGLGIEIWSGAADVPEPSSICLAALGLVGVATAYRRRKHVA